METVDACVDGVHQALFLGLGTRLAIHVHKANGKLSLGSLL